MAIYRPPKPRWPLAVAAGIAGLIVGLLACLAIGSEEPDAREGAQLVRSTMVAAASTLEVAAIEYDESVEDGRVVREAEYEGALAAVARSRSTYGEVAAALEALAPETAIEIADSYDGIRRSMEEVSEPSEVAADLEGLEAVLKGEG